MKRIIISFITIAILVTSLFSLPALAETNNRFDIDISVKIYDNGDALVTQKWYGEFKKGTENYLPIGNLANGMDISDFKVWDKNGNYEYIDDWDVNADREEKQNKCGIINTDNGYELCYGIGDYGNNTYNFSYKIKGLVGSYNDKDGFNFQFVNPGMNCYPTNVKVTIESADYKYFNNSNCDIWAFGYQGSISFTYDNKILAQTSSPIDDSDRYVNIVVSFKKGVLSPVRLGEEDSFEKLLENAKEGSSYGSNDEDDSFTIIIIGIIIIVAIVFIVIPLIIISIINKLNLKKFEKQVTYFRDIPCNKNMPLTFALASKYKQNEKESSIIGACILDLINKGCLVPQIQNDVGFMGKTKKIVNLALTGMPSEHNTPSSKLYNILFKAAGDDGILQEKELKNYCKKHPETLRDFINNTKAGGEGIILSNGEFKSNINKSSEFVKTNLKEIIGFKKYLLDFSLINERSIEENAIWEDLLVYATLLDIADKVIDEFKKVYPDNIEQFERYDDYIWLAFAYRNITYNAMVSGEAARSAGSGGSSSIGGGGGFSGGGVGGGSR